MIAVSVIIPVFNASKYLEKCIQSLLSQSISDCEFIFVNDGSSDESQEIIERYQKINTKIHLINQDNQGVSEARNNGLKIAKGDYIGFVDADDFIDDNYYQTLYSIAKSNECDIVICNYFSSQDGHQFTSKHPFDENIILKEKFIQKNIIPHFIGNANLNSIWNKLYKRELIFNNNIQFPKGVALGEDGLFNVNCFSSANSVYFTNYAGYHYIEVTGSATRDFQSKNYFHRLEQEFQHDYSYLETEFLTLEEIAFLKAKKFINKSIALLHEYYSIENNLKKSQIKKLVAEILNNKTTRKIIKKHYKVLFSQKSKYEKILLFGLKFKLPIVISSAIKYSKYRNKK